MKRYIMMVLAIACMVLGSINMISQAQTHTMVMAGDYNNDGRYTAVDALLAAKRGYSQELVQGLLQIASGEKEMNYQFRLKLIKQDGITELNQYKPEPDESVTYHKNRQEILDQASIDIANAETEDVIASIITNAKKEIDDALNHSGTGGWTPIV